MNFIIGRYKNEINKINKKSNKWCLLKEPEGINIISLFIVFLFSSFYIFLLEAFGIDYNLGLKNLIVVLFVIPLHEIFHALVLPGGLVSDKKVFGFSPKDITFYVHFKNSLSKKRLLMVLGSPIVFLSILPFSIILLFSIENNYLLYFVLLNWLFSGKDLIRFFLVSMQVPRNTVLKESKDGVYWKKTNNIN